MYTCPMHELIECPTRANLVECLEGWLVPRVLSRLKRTERRTRRSVGYDVAGDLQQRCLWARRHPKLDEVAAVVHWYAWTWMATDPAFRGRMLSDPRPGSALAQWWVVVQSMLKAGRTARRVDWPATPTHPVAQRYEPRHCPTTTLVRLLHDLFILWCS